MVSKKPAAATATDPEGREVVLLARIWEEKISRDLPSWSTISKPGWRPSLSPTMSSRTRFPPAHGSTGVARAEPLADGGRKL
jgi:hypothetical protein